MTSAVDVYSAAGQMLARAAFRAGEPVDPGRVDPLTATVLDVTVDDPSGPVVELSSPWRVGAYWDGPLPPFNLPERPFAVGAHVTGATALLRWTFTHTAFGAVEFDMPIVDGVPQSGRDEPEAAFTTQPVEWTVPYIAFLALCSGRLNEATEVLAPPGTAAGELDLTMMLAGLLDTAAWRSWLEIPWALVNDVGDLCRPVQMAVR